MRPAAELAVAGRDPALPGLAVLLDAEALGGLLGAAVTGRYLRYKPGTSCVAAVRLATGEDVVVTAYAASAQAKTDKTVRGLPDAVLAHDDVLRLLVTRPSADRDLPALAVLADPRRGRRLLRRLLPGFTSGSAVAVSTLAYKPHRRWVGLAEIDGRCAVLRAYPPSQAAVAADAVRRLAAHGPRTPVLLGHDVRRGLLALEHLPGRDLAAALGSGDAGAGDVRAAGRALAALHAGTVAGLPSRGAGDAVAAVHAAAAQLAGLLPDLAEPAGRLAEHLARLLAELPEHTSTLHGDFSLDQVVLDDSRIALIDLDRAAVGHPAADLASAAAALAVAGDAHRAAETLAELDSGYRQVAALPDGSARAVHTAAALLQRAAEPFRTCRPGWPDAVRALLDAARTAVPEHRAAVVARPGSPLDRSPVDLLSPVLGAPVDLQVLKDKPGRRRTSRATGSRGTAIVKVYASGRAPVVAARLRALADGPAEPAVPQVLLCDEERHTVVLSEVPGEPFASALLRADRSAAERVGRALAAWHGTHRDRVPAGLREHTAAREGALLLERADAAPEAIGDAVRAAAPALLSPWRCDTVVHRDLYEEQVVLGSLVGLIDLDDAAAGPAELDVGNLAAHLRLLGERTGAPTDRLLTALLTAYTAVSPLDPDLLDRCRSLSLLRLACLHRDPGLLPLPA